MSKPSDAMQLLEKHFDTAFAAPDGIKKLRELILALAMQGKLVPQDPNDQPARELMREIEAEKKRLVKAGKIKAPKPLPEIKPEEVPYGLPKGWEWVQLDKLAPMSIADGDWIESKDQDPDGNIRLIQLADVGVNEFKNVSERFINLDTFDRLKCTELLQGDILIARLPNPIGRACIFPGLPKRAITAVDVAILRPLNVNFFDAQYVVHAINSPFFRMQVEQHGKGSTRFRIATGNLKTILAPLPPLPEQRRIVAKIDQLMARCDELEKLRTEYGQKRIAAHTAALNRLLTATEAETFSAIWDFITQNFCELYYVKENVIELRKAILQLAVMGKLVPQNSNDQPASELLKEIEVEKKRLVKAGKIKVSMPLPAILPEEVPYELPKGWEWVRLNEALDVRDGTHDTPKYVDIGYPLITSKNLYSGELSFDDIKYISKQDHAKISERSKVDLGDILFAMIGSIGNPALVKCDEEFSIKNVALFKFYIPNKPDNRYLHYFLTHAQENMKAKSSGAVQSFVSLSYLRNYLCPLPPLTEQGRIVAKIDQLMALCDELEKQIDTATGKQTALLNAVMARV